MDLLNRVDIALRACGRMGDRRHKLNAEQPADAVKLHQGGDYTVKEICPTLKISLSTLYNYLQE